MFSHVLATLLGPGRKYLISPLTVASVSCFDPPQENMVLGLVGETIDVGDEICGARIVDKSKGHHVVYRFELWLRTNDHSTADRCGVGEASFVIV